MIASNSWWKRPDCFRSLDYSLVVVEEPVFLVAIGKVTPVLEGVDVTVASTSVAVVKVEAFLVAN